MEGNMADSRGALGMRGVRLGELPTLSVLVSSRGERKRLMDCLESLLPQCEVQGAEVLVVRAGDAAELIELSAAYPQVRFVGAEPGSEDRHLRATGVRHAVGDIVVLQEDVLVAPDWLAQHARLRRMSAVEPAPGNKSVTE
jgi:glycosyltransferase involved in cell wall biosynthesis